MKRIAKIAFLILILSVSACSKRTENVELPAPPEKIYPHSKEFKESNMHGLSYYLEKGLCVQCHQEMEATAEVGKKDLSCTKCHNNFPHSGEFKASHLHAKNFFEDPVSCKTCHGDDYNGGNSKISCKQCHNYPHEPLWALPKNHGAAYTAKSKEPVQCATCHDKAGSLATHYKERFAACDSCHIEVPHSFDVQWGHSNVAKTYAGKCTICHSYSEKDNGYKLFSDDKKAGCKLSGCHDKEKRNTPRMEFPL